MDFPSVSLEQKPQAFIQGWAAFFDGFNESDVAQFYDTNTDNAQQWIMGLREARQANTFQDFDPNYINFRTISNPNITHPWEPMRHIMPPTFDSLVKHLKQCSIDPEGLEIEHAVFENGQLLRYGAHKQFWLPDEATPDELKLLRSWRKLPTDVYCPMCSARMYVGSRMLPSCNEESYYAACFNCKIEITKYNAIAPTPAIISKLLKKRS